MLKKILVSIMIISLMGTFTPISFIAPAYAQDTGVKVKLEVVNGPVQYKTAADTPWTDVTGEMPIDVGYYVNVGPGGSAIASFPDGSVIRVFENSMIRIYNVADLGKVREYNIRFLGKIVAKPVKNTQTASEFNSNSPTTDLSSEGIEYSAEVETDLFLRVDIISGKAVAKEAYKTEGKVKEIFPEENYFILEIGEDKFLTVRTYPHTIYFEKYKNYRKTGNPADLGNLNDLEAGQTVIVYGEFDPEGHFFGIVDPKKEILHATLITDRCLLPVAPFWITPPTVTAITPLVGAGLAGVLVFIFMGGDEGANQSVSPTSPNIP